VNWDGKEIAPPIYESALSFAKNGIMLTAPVTLNGKAGIIDTNGNIVVPFMYEPDFEDDNNYRLDGGYANVKLNGKWGVIDEKNNIVLPFVYDKFLVDYNAGWRYALRNGEKLSIDTKGNERIMQKNPEAQTFADYLHRVTWKEVAECFLSLSLEDEDLPHHDLSIHKENFDIFLATQHKQSQDIIRTHADGEDLDITNYSVKEEYAGYDWGEMLDMEIRIEDNLTPSDAEVVALCLWFARRNSYNRR
jgi:hypothetical protein